MDVDLSPQTLLEAYSQGVFPMADERGRVHWYTCEPRAVIDLKKFHASRTLRRLYRQGRFELTINRDFCGVIEGCADRSDGTWINSEIREAYVNLHRLGYAHSVEAWADGKLAGGLYGVAMGGAFFGESMFHRVSNASKVALTHLVDRMRQRGFVLLDTQFTTEHLMQFGCEEIPRDEYIRRLNEALQVDATFDD